MCEGVCLHVVLCSLFSGFQDCLNLDPLAPVQSKHHFRHAISMRLWTKCGPRDLLKKTPNIRTQNNTFCACWCRFPSPRVLPKAPPGRQFGIIFGTFCMTWPDDLSRLLPASNFQPKTTLQTSTSIRSEQAYQQNATNAGQVHFN